MFPGVIPEYMKLNPVVKSFAETTGLEPRANVHEPSANSTIPPSISSALDDVSPPFEKLPI